MPVSLPAKEALDNTSFENLVVENIPASAVDVNLANESANTVTTANPATEVNSATTAVLNEEVTAPAPVIENATPVNLEESSPVYTHQQLMSVCQKFVFIISVEQPKQVTHNSAFKQMCFTQRFKLLLSLNTTKLLLRQQPLPMKMEKHGILLNTMTWCLTTRVITVLQKKELFQVPLLMSPTSMMMLALPPTVAQQARFVDDKGQEIAPTKVNMVRRDIDLAYYAYSPTAPKTIQVNGKT